MSLKRVLKGKAIPHEEKLFSIFEPHTRRIAKGKAGRPVELGIPVCVCENQYGFILNHEVMWSGRDVDVAVGFTEETIKRHPESVACSYGRGFHSPENHRRLDRKLASNALPKKGRLNAKEREREEAPEFVEARQQYPAVESAIDHLEHCGLDRVRAHGARGFEHSAALSAMSANLKRLGRLLLEREHKRFTRESRWQMRERLRLAA